ncbi:MAG TPA: glutathione S-transferase family protein [Micropepsaceae bacterium]|nr:glutathione S-transferase family protein [Micropepsaceae bacterium]
MTMTGLELYHGLPSTCSKKVRLVLYEKQLPFKSHLMDLRKFEQHAPDYLKLNPNGVVPTLVHDGRVVTESSVIMEYLEDVFPQTQLRPRDAYISARMRLWLKFSDDVAYPAVYAPTWMILNRDAMKNLSVTEREQVLARIPQEDRRKRWAEVSTHGFSEDVLMSAVEKMRGCLARCNDTLADSSWLAGHYLTLADYAMLPFIDRIHNLSPEFFSAGAYRHVDEWYARLKQRPAVTKALDFKDDPRVPEMINI